ncbi:MAG: alpha-glucosidase/alpha-galactosidase [Anaerolineae bacterium]|nr:alpha-glucosidase/alpha-galactosidase [Anaerolineae bacterium]
MPDKEVARIKIAYLGGGSRGWAHVLMRDLALSPVLSGEVYLYDINLEAAKLNEEFGTWIQQQPGAISDWRYYAVPTIEEALRDADFVICSIQPGPLEAMEQDLAIPAKYGLLYPVGDTIGAPGLVRGLRAALIYEDFAQKIADLCPQAWVINYTNPMTICTRTLTKVCPELKVFGCCHEVFGVQELLAELVEKYLGAPRPNRREIEVNVLGINHFTWIDHATYKGHDLLELVRHHIAQEGVLRPYTKEEVLSWNSYFACAHQVKYQLFKHYGVLAAAGDRHLAEFVPGFLTDEETVYRYGFSLTPISYRYQRWEEAPAKIKAIMEGKEPFKLEHSSEEGTEQMCALLGLGDMMTNCNLPNEGQIPNLPLGAVVETNAYFSRDSVRPLTAGPLPEGVINLVEPHVRNQEMIVEAALTRDVDLAFQAVFSDPLTTLPIDKAWAMFQEMLQATKEWLPGFDI